MATKQVVSSEFIATDVAYSGGLYYDPFLPSTDNEVVSIRASVKLQNVSLPLKPEYRLILVQQNGEMIAELPDAVPGTIRWQVAGPTQFEFTIPNNAPFADLCKPMQSEFQLYRGTRLLLWGVMLRATDDGLKTTIQCQDLSYYFTKRLVGRVPRWNYLMTDEENNNPMLAGRPARRANWELASLPRSSPRAKPVKSYSTDIRYSEYPSLALTSSTGRTIKTIANDTLYAGNTATLTSAGKTALNSAIADTFGERPTVTVHVYDDKPQSKNLQASRQLAQARCDVIADYILDRVPGAKVMAINDAYRNPIATNSTAPGRATNRRTTLTYRDDDGKKTQKQVARYFLSVRNPKSNQKKRQFTLSAYVYLQSVANYASSFAGVELVLYDPSKPHKDKKWAKEGYKRVRQSSVFPIGKDSPPGTWIRCTATVTLPNDGKKSLLEARLWVPNGDVFYDEAWLTSNDSLWYKNVEQAEIIKELVTHAQDESLGKSDLGIEQNIQKTGVERTREYTYMERMTIYEALEEFPTLAGGVEWDIVCTPQKRVFTTYYPRKGSDTSVVLANDSSLVQHSVDIDGTELSSTIVLLTDLSNGFDREERSIQDDSIADGLVLERALTSTPNSPGSSWRKQAERGLARYRRPAVMPNVMVSTEYTDEFLKSLAVGDRVMTFLQDDYMDSAQKYRITEMGLNPQLDQIALGLAPEDLNIVVLAGRESAGWKYTSSAQPAGNRPQERNTDRHQRDFNDSAWPSGQAGIGWVKDATGPVIQRARFQPKTSVPVGREVWMRKWVQCTGDMVIHSWTSDWGYVYVNGHLLTGRYLTGFNWNLFGRPFLYVPHAWLHPSGNQLISIQAGSDPKRRTSNELDSLYAAVQVRGTYDPKLIVP